MKDIVIYDNGGKTIDRITVVFLKEKERQADGTLLHAALATCETGRAFFQHVVASRGRHLGKKVAFSELHPDLQTRLNNYFNNK